MKRFLALLMMIALLGTFAAAENSYTVRLLGDIGNYDVYGAYKAQGNHLNFRYSTFNDIATAISSRDPDVDVFILLTRDGGDQLKKQHYYYPLTDDALLMEKFSHLYPSLQSPLMDDGNLIGWYIDVQPWAWDVSRPDWLEELDCPLPTTFEELLDACELLNESGLLGAHQPLLDYYSYTQSGVLTFYMEQYLISSELADGQINFLRPEFTRIVKRIKETLPATQPDIGHINDIPVFLSGVAYEAPTTKMTLIPSVLDDAPTALYCIAVVAVINPYSNNIEGALDFIHYLATYESTYTYYWDATLPPLIRPNYDEEVAECQDEIARLEAKEKLSEQDESDLYYARRSLTYITENPYYITEEDIAHYRDLIQYAYVPCDSPINFYKDDAFQTLMQRYLNGAFDAERFARACQEHVNTVYLEMGLTPMYVPN